MAQTIAEIKDRTVISPMMQKYLETKDKYKDCILFYRLGDFYEMFFEDALIASRELEITLTGKDCGLEERAPMAGVPHHAAENYAAKLIEKGYKVAICEQLEDPKTAKGIVERGVIRILTPGTIVESNLLEEKKNNYIMSICKSGIYYGLSVCDISTGEFYSCEIKDENNFALLLDEIARFSPSEIIANSMMFECEEELKKIRERFQIYMSRFNDKFFNEEEGNLALDYNIIENKKQLTDLKDKKLVVKSINALIEYLNETQMTSLEHINTITIYNISRYMLLDVNARRNLEITEKMRDKSKKGTLLWVLDKTSTSMGGRLLRRWLNDPLLDIKEIQDRLDAVKELKENLMLRGDITETLKKVYDIERLAGKMAYGNANARDMITLKNSLQKLPDVKNVLSQCESTKLKELYEELDELKDIFELIDKSIIEDPPMTIKDGGIIKMGYDPEIDKLKTATTEGKNWIVKLETEEKAKTGIKTLKIGYNKVFGYYFEVSKSFVTRPVNWITGVDTELPYAKVIYELPDNVNDTDITSIEYHKVFESVEFPRWDLLYCDKTKGEKRNKYYDRVARKLGMGKNLKDSDQEVKPRIKEIVVKTSLAKNISSYLWAAVGVGLAFQKPWDKFFSAKGVKQSTGQFFESLGDSVRDFFKGTGKSFMGKHCGKMLFGAAALSSILGVLNVVASSRRPSKLDSADIIEKDRKYVVN